MRFFSIFRTITLRIIAMVNIIAVLVMWLCAYIGHVSPERLPLGEVLALAFPAPLIVNLLFLLFWLFFHRRYALIPIVGMLVCWQSIWDYCPWHFRQEVPEGAIKVMSYNVCNFVGPDYDKSKALGVAEHICESGADIVCLQETGALRLSLKKKVEERLSQEYAHGGRLMKKDGEEVSIYTRYPVLWCKELPIDKMKNQSAVFCLDIKGTQVLVYNCHLQSIGFDKEDKDELRGGNLKNIDERSLISKMRASAPLRARQADFIAKELKANEGKAVILCGDFNCSPTCYAHTTICNLLTDCYKASGRGLGFTYNNGETYARIDNIFCSKDFECYGCEVDTEIDVSDHYPVVCWVKMPTKP